MIPIHRPPFGIGTVVAVAMRGGAHPSLLRLEEEYAEASGCAGAVWLPSDRAGICWALRASIGAKTRVVGPAFVCSVVHEAMVRSGGQIQLVDAGDDFLMAAPTLFAAMRCDHALVLSEVYGHTYDLAEIAQQTASPPVVRIVDMAMSVPQPELFRRLRANDFAVISFGTGKPMYTGWGAMGLTANQGLANEVRERRDALLVSSSFRLRLQRTAKLYLRTVAHYPAIYSVGQRLRARLPGAGPPWLPSVGLPPVWLDDRTTSREWKHPSTSADRGLSLWNLAHADSLNETHLTLAQRYNYQLKAAEGIVRPPPSPYALSHYTVRVSPDLRSRVQQRLYQQGVNTVTLWPFCQYLDWGQFPNAFRLSTSVLNLPLSHWMSTRDVDRICEVLKWCLAACSHETARPNPASN